MLRRETLPDNILKGWSLFLRNISRSFHEPFKQFKEQFEQFKEENLKKKSRTLTNSAIQYFQDLPNHARIYFKIFF